MGGDNSMGSPRPGREGPTRPSSNRILQEEMYPRPCFCSSACAMASTGGGESTLLFAAVRGAVASFSSHAPASPARSGSVPKAAGLALGFLTEAQFDEWIVPADMTGPKDK